MFVFITGKKIHQREVKLNYHSTTIIKKEVRSNNYWPGAATFWPSKNKIDIESVGKSRVTFYKIYRSSTYL